MSEETPKYYAVLTDAGAELEARALAEGKAVVLSHIAVGDANMQMVTPDPSVTALVHEQYRMPIDTRTRDEHDRNVTLLHATIPAHIGGWWIYEQGVIGHLDGEEEEVLYAYANHARYYKVLPTDGQSLTHTVTVPIIQCTDAQVTINIMDEGYATAEQFRVLSGRVDGLEVAQAGTLTHVLRLSDRMTREALARMARDNDMELELALLREREDRRDAREAAQGRDTLRALDRITRLELAQASGVAEVTQAVVGEGHCGCGCGEAAEADLVGEFEDVLHDALNGAGVSGDGSGAASAS